MIDLSVIKRLMEQRTRGSGEDFDFVFYQSANDVIRDMMNDTALTTLTEIDLDDPDDEVDLDPEYFGVFRDGISYYMQKNAVWAKQGDELSDSDYRRQMARAQGYAMADLAVGLDYEDDE